MNLAIEHFKALSEANRLLVGEVNERRKKIEATQKKMQDILYRVICMIDAEYENTFIRELKEYHTKHGRLTQRQFNAFVASCDSRRLKEYYFDIYENPLEHTLIEMPTQVKEKEIK